MARTLRARMAQAVSLDGRRLAASEERMRLAEHERHPGDVVSLHEVLKEARRR